MIPALDSSLNRMEQILNTLVEDGSAVGGFNDGPLLRERIQSNSKQLVQLSSTVKREILSLKEQNDPNVNQYEEKFARLAQRMKQELPQVLDSLKKNQITETHSSSQAISTTPLLQQDVVDGTTEQIEELEVAVREILSTMTQLHSIFTQTLDELQKQRNVILSVDTAVSNAHDDMHKGNDQLDTATKHQKGSTKCLIWIFIIVALVVLGIALGIYFGTSKKDPEPTPTPTPTPMPTAAPTPAQLLRFLM